MLCSFPSSSAPKPDSRLRTASLRIAALLLLTTACAASAQTLVRPGWAGSGLNIDPWWKHAVFYNIGATPSETNQTTTFSPETDFKALTLRLDALRALGVDALLLPAPHLPTLGLSDSAAPNPALDDLDDLIHQASRRDIRVLVTLPASSVTADLSAAARFWISRGVAGFHLVTPPETTPQDAQSIAQALRKITNSAIGQRIVLTDLSPAASTSTATPPQQLRISYNRHNSRRSENIRADRRNSSASDSASAQLVIDPRLTHLDPLEASNLRPLLAQSLQGSNLLLDFHAPAPHSNAPNPYPALAKAMATLLLTTHSTALIDADREIQSEEIAAHEAADREIARNKTNLASNLRPAATPAPASLADWYSQLSALHRGNATLRYGNVAPLNFDSQNALVWVSHTTLGSSLTPPVVVACNLSSSPLQLSLGDAIKAINLRGTYLRTLLRSDSAIGPQDLNNVILPPFGVYIGELHR
jgi:alpha-glucosidase